MKTLKQTQDAIKRFKKKNEIFKGISYLRKMDKSLEKFWTNNIFDDDAEKLLKNEHYIIFDEIKKA